jgi:hypothetical protein
MPGKRATGTKSNPPAFQLFAILKVGLNGSGDRGSVYTAFLSYPSTHTES